MAIRLPAPSGAVNYTRYIAFDSNMAFSINLRLGNTCRHATITASANPECDAIEDQLKIRGVCAMPSDSRLDSLLADLNTITAIAKAGVISTREERIRPGETRPSAVLFIDVVGFTELSRALGHEHIATLIDRTFRIFELTAQA